MERYEYSSAANKYSSQLQAVENPLSLSKMGCRALLALLVLHRAKLLASNQSVLALGVAPMRVVSRWCRCVVQRLCATDFKRPCLVGRQPHTQPRHGCRACMPKGFARTQSQPSIHSPSPRGRGLGFRQGCRDRTPKGFAGRKAHKAFL